MNEIKNRERILEAIDQLRRRKARPDIHRICNFLTRRFAIDSNDIRADLQRCVEREIVLKVEYKGSISYRNAARKFSHLKREGTTDISEVNANRNFASLLTNAIAELIVQEPDYLELGVPGPELIKNILSKDSVKYTRKYLTLLLQREVDNGGLVKMENGHYSLGPSHDSDKSEEELIQEEEIEIPVPAKIKKKPGPKPGFRKLNDNESRSQHQEINGNGFRVGGRRKRAKKVFDPSENNMPRIIRKRGRPAGSLNRNTLEKHLSRPETADTSRPGSSASSFGGKDNQGGVCSVCHNHGKKGATERMVCCRECSNKAHFSCLSGEEGVLRMYPDNTWQCPHCKTCVICFETSDAGYLTVCSICADAYHLTCHDPSIPDKVVAKGIKWTCRNCQMPDSLTPIEFKPKNHSDEQEDKMTIRTTASKSCTPSVSGHSSPSNYRSLPPSPTPPTLSPQAVHNGGRQSRSSTEFKFNLSDSQSIKDFDLEENVDMSIPDASKWTYEEVYNYFVQYFPDEAIVFKEQEIDGPSLLLMKRLDVLTSLKLKLGPALKIYRHVLKLQVRRDDPKLYWL